MVFRISLIKDLIKNRVSNTSEIFRGILISNSWKFLLQLLLLKVQYYTEFSLNYDKMSRSNRPEVFLGTGVLKICSKFTGKHSCRICKATILKSHYGMGVLL